MRRGSIETSRATRVSFAAALVVAAPFAGVEPAAAAQRWVAGYYVGYERALYPVGAIDFGSLTHIMVGRYVPKSDGTLDRGCDWDATRCPAWARAVGVRAHAAGRSAILFLGGAGAHAGFVAAARPARRATFVRNIVKAVKDLGFDGVDIDWEPVEAADVEDLVALIKALRAAMPTKTITMPVNFTNLNFPGAGLGWVKRVAPSLDQINIMTYEMDGSGWGWTRTWHTAALRGATPEMPTSVATSVDAYLALGVPRAKLGIGFGFFGQCWKGGVTGPRQPQGASTIVGNPSYAAIMATYHRGDAYRYDKAAAASYLGRAAGLGPARCTYLSYEDPRSIAAKVAYLKAKGLGGGIIWTISQGWRPKTGTNAPLTAVGEILK